jgi:glycogen phosphorylase
MKFALNGALTIGTLDGANIEIKEEVGDDNIFIFGMTAEEVQNTKRGGYRPSDYYERIPDLKKIIDMIRTGYFSPSDAELFKPLIDNLLSNDPFMLLADFESYLKAQEAVSRLYLNPHEWTRKSILNVAQVGKFSSDRTIAEYAKEIWNAKTVPILMD